MKIPREYRFEDNPTEEKLIKEFLKDWGEVSHRLGKGLEAFTDVVLTEEMEKERNYLNDREEMIILNTIQWLGSNVGRGFLKRCGFEKENPYGFDDTYPDHSSNQQP